MSYRFNVEYDKGFARSLYLERINLVISTYHANRLIFLHSTDGINVIQVPISFPRPMGVAISSDNMAVATRNDIRMYKGSQLAAETYPDRKNNYKSIFLPKKVHITGPVDMHDIHFDSDGKLFGVNTMFSCLVTLEELENFSPVWKPSFIDELVPEDRCHLNGLAMKDGTPAYVTALGSTNDKRGWRKNILNGGVIIDLESNEIISHSLAMPHSPRMLESNLIVLESAAGKLLQIDRDNGKAECILEVPNLLRGITLAKDHIFLAFSKARSSSKLFKDLPVSQYANTAGILVLDKRSMKVKGKLSYQTTVEEIYDIQSIDIFGLIGMFPLEKPDYLNSVELGQKIFWLKKGD